MTSCTDRHLLEVADLALTYVGTTHPVLQRASLVLDRGEIVAILGPSGCGKSSFIRACLDMLPSSAMLSGSICFGGSSLMKSNEDRVAGLRGRKIGWMTQAVATALEPRTSLGRQLVEVVGELRGLDAKRAGQRLAERLDMFGRGLYETFFPRRWAELSGGQKRIVLAALWLSIEPELLFMDEPSVGLDHDRMATLADEIRTARESTGMGVVIVTHDMRFAKLVADRYLAMHNGALEPALDRVLQSEISLVGKRSPTVDHQTTLSVRGLSKSFSQIGGDVPAIKNLDFDVRPGRVLAIWGSSGSGKTTAVRCALRLLEPDSGEIMFAGANLLDFSERALREVRKRMQLVEQDAHSTLDPNWRVMRAITEGIQWHRIRFDRDCDPVEVWMESIGLPMRLLSRRCSQLSIGEGQRVAVVRSLIMEPELLVLDEPSANLDPEAREWLIASVRLYISRTNGGVILVSHDADLVNALADEVVDLENLSTTPD